MSTYTKYLSLELPDNGEYRDSWEIPTNGNFSKIDSNYGVMREEIRNARFSKATLKEFLEVSHNTDGTLKPTSEVEEARNSFLYGHKSGTELYTLDTLSLARDKMMWSAWEGQPSLRDAIANRLSMLPDQILTGSKDPNGYPTWAGYTAAKATVDGSSTAIYININGYLCRIRTEEDVEISGGAGTYYIYAQYEADGVVIDSGSGAVCGEDGNQEVRLHEKSSANYVTAGVQVGDLLRYSSPAVVAGDYIIEEVAPDGETEQLLIRNTFPEANASVTFEIIDPLAVTLGFADDPSTLTANQFVVMEADFNGTNVTAVRPRNYTDKFVSEWRAIDTATDPTFEEIFNHYMGTDVVDVVIQASQANDGSAPVEELSLAKINNSLGVTADKGTLAVGLTDNLTHTVTNTLVTQSGGTDPHTHIVDGTGDLTVEHGGSISAALSGDPSVALTGDVTPYNSVVMKASRNQVWVKNAVASYFYRDYDGADRQTGYLRVIVTRKG